MVRQPAQSSSWRNGSSGEPQVSSGPLSPASPEPSKLDVLWATKTFSVPAAGLHCPLAVRAVSHCEVSPSAQGPGLQFFSSAAPLPAITLSVLRLQKHKGSCFRPPLHRAFRQMQPKRSQQSILICQPGAFSSIKHSPVA